MLRKAFVSTIALFSLFVMAGFASAQTIQGKVIAPNTVTPEQIEIVLEMDGQPVIRSYADSSGAFFLRGMPFGAYDVVARAYGYEDSRLRVEVSAGPAGDSSPIVNLQLERKTEETAAQPGASRIGVAGLKRNYPKKILQAFEKGIKASREGHAAEAIEHLEIVVRDAPDFYDAHNLLGSSYQRLNQFRDAEKEYKLAQRLDPQAALPMVNLGNLYVKEADSTDPGRRPRGRALNDALDALDEALRLDPQSAVACYLLGLAYYKSDSSAEAEPNLKRALELDPQMGAAHLVLINLYSREEKWEDALKNVNAYLTGNPRAPNRAGLEAARRKLMEKLED